MKLTSGLDQIPVKQGPASRFIVEAKFRQITKRFEVFAEVCPGSIQEKPNFRCPKIELL